jgi:putative transposase
MARPWQQPKCRSDGALACRSVPKGKSTEAIIGILREAEVLIERWRRHQNTRRLHSSLGYRPPAPVAVLLSASPLAYASPRQPSRWPPAAGFSLNPWYRIEGQATRILGPLPSMRLRVGPSRR